MAISLIGTPQSGSNTNGGDVTLTFDVAPSQNDVVVVFGGYETASAAIGPSTAGYTNVVAQLTGTHGLSLDYKVMGASPDTTVVCQGGGAAADAVVYVAYVLRGVDTGTVQDAAPTPTSASSGAPDPLTITTVTDGAWVLAFAVSKVNDATPGTISGYSNHVSGNATDTNPYTAAGATKLVATAGAEDPGAWSSWASAGWRARTWAVRPAVLPTVTTQAVSAITTTTATGNGNITATGGANADARGFVISTTTHGDPGNVAYTVSGYEGNTVETGDFGTGAFTGGFTGRVPNTTYFVRAWAHNTVGYSYGGEVTFTMLPPPHRPTIINHAPTRAATY